MIRIQIQCTWIHNTVFFSLSILCWRIPIDFGWQFIIPVSGLFFSGNISGRRTQQQTSARGAALATTAAIAVSPLTSHRRRLRKTCTADSRAYPATTPKTTCPWWCVAAGARRRRFGRNSARLIAAETAATAAGSATVIGWATLRRALTPPIIQMAIKSEKDIEGIVFYKDVNSERAVHWKVTECKCGDKAGGA